MAEWLLMLAQQRNSQLPGITMIPNRLRAGLLLSLGSILLAGCPMPVTPYPDPDSFARAIFRVAHEGDAAEWGTLLTAARRALGKQYVRDHFEKWQRLVLEIEEGPYAGDLSIAHFRVNDGALEFETEGKWVHMFRVELEDGGWKINQD
jgi:hypothetical protein